MYCPNRLVPNWANIYNVNTTVMERYCATLPSAARLPRGMNKKLSRLRLRCASPSSSRSFPRKFPPFLSLAYSYPTLFSY